MNRVLKIAHRGYSARYPENTLLAFEKAIDAGAHMIEFDLHLTKDGHPVVIHDDFIDRTSDGSGMVREMELAELRRFNYSYIFRDAGHQHLPLFEEVVELAAGRIMLNIEIKNCPYRHPGIEEKIADIIVKKNMVDECIISSFDHYALAKMKELEPEIKTGMLYNAVWIHFIEEVEKLKVYSIHPHVDVADPRHLEYSEKAGIKVYPWVARDSHTVERLLETGGVHGIMADELELLKTV
jgi:glycerophosphoryl diester phosphodiesterase